MEQEGRSRMVEMSLVLVGFRPGPGSSVGRATGALDLRWSLVRLPAGVMVNFFTSQ